MIETEQTTKSLKSFFAIGDFFVKKVDPKKEITLQASFFLENENYEAYFRMVNNGYTPTEKQQKLIDGYINYILFRPSFVTDRADRNSIWYPNVVEMYGDLEKQLEQGLTLTYNNARAFLYNNYQPTSHNYSALMCQEEFLSNPNYVLKTNKGELPNLTKQLQSILSQPEFSDYLYKDFIQQTKTKHYDRDGRRNSYKVAMEKYEYVLEYNPKLLFKNVPFSEFSKLITKLKNSSRYNEDSEMLNHVTNTVYNSEVDDIVAKTQKNYSQEVVKNLTLEKIKAQQNNIEEIPPNALAIIEGIETTFNKIKKNPDLSHYQNEIAQLDNFLEKRIPEVLSKYLTIDPSYRTTMVSSQGKNAEQLMLESLENIQKSFVTVFENINQNNVDALSATNRYTRSAKI